MRTQGSIEIDRPIDDVFRLTNDHVAEWSLTVVSDEILERTANVVGTTFHTVTNGHGATMEFDGVVTAYEPPFRNVVSLSCKSFDLDVEYQFEVVGEGTRVTQISDVHPKGFLKIIFALFGWLMVRSSGDELTKELQSLKSFCESRSLNE